MLAAQGRKRPAIAVRGDDEYRAAAPQTYPETVGFEPKPESPRLRVQLMAELKRLIQARKLTQNSAAKLFGVTQPRISDLVRGKIDFFSIETLVDMLNRAGIRVQLRLAPVRPHPRHQAA